MSAGVVVVGAGPSGCSAAILLARAGWRVKLVDKEPRGRDKVCGDALIPDAFGALEALGCDAEVLARTHLVGCVRIDTPAHAPIEVRGRLGCLPRAQLDAVLLRAAEQAGAEFLSPMAFEGLLERAGRVTGVRLSQPEGASVELPADHVVLATGAAAGPLAAAGMCLRRAPSGVALRAYFGLPAGLADQLAALTLRYDPALSPGYGWIFPGPGHVFNVGVGCFHDSWRRPPSRNLRELWGWFLQSCRAAGEISRFGRQLGPARGAPLRTSLRGARITRPGLMLVGEAIGTTYALTGEGIGKAMQSGMLAAECLLHRPEAPEVEYERQLHARFRGQYDAYRAAQQWLPVPWVCSLLAHRAHRGRFVRSAFEGMLAETMDPRELFSLRGLVRAAFA